jgi:two-component system, cell cycle sensor histidine kinase and response regulator CckA
MGSAIEPNAARKKTVLLVDDESAITLLFELELTRMGYHVLTAHSGAEAIRMSAEIHYPIDVLVTDWHMLEQSGHHLACDLLVQRQDLKVILMSGYQVGGAYAQVFNPNKLVFLHKPFSTATLDETILRLLGLAGKSDR